LTSDDVWRPLGYELAKSSANKNWLKIRSDFSSYDENKIRIALHRVIWLIAGVIVA